MATHTTKMLIIGSGPAGLSAAIYGARAGMQPIVVQGLQPGGQLTITTDVENYPGFRDVIQGPWLMQEMQAQAEHVGTRMLWDTIVEVDMIGSPFRAIGDSGDVSDERVELGCDGPLKPRLHLGERGLHQQFPTQLAHPGCTWATKKRDVFVAQSLQVPHCLGGTWLEIGHHVVHTGHNLVHQHGWLDFIDALNVFIR